MMTPGYTTFVKGIIPSGSEKRSKMTNSQTKLPRSKQRRSCPLLRAAGSSKNWLRSATLFPNRLSFLQLSSSCRARPSAFDSFHPFAFVIKSRQSGTRGDFSNGSSSFSRFPVRETIYDRAEVSRAAPASQNTSATKWPP